MTKQTKASARLLLIDTLSVSKTRPEELEAYLRKRIPAFVETVQREAYLEAHRRGSGYHDYSTTEEAFGDYCEWLASHNNDLRLTREIVADYNNENKPSPPETE